MKLGSTAIVAVVLLAVLGLGIYGMGRSLWLDEAWVANSVQSPTLGGMFYYPGWLQVNPPLFLLLVRGAVRLAGASNVAFRLVPLLLACAASFSLFAVSRRLLRLPLAALATAIVMLDPTAIEYSRTLKPYSGELAASALLLLMTVSYLQRPDRARFVWLLGAVAVAMTLAYPMVFLVPGIVLAMAGGGSSRIGSRTSAALLAAGSGSVLLAMYWFSIRPNLSPQLHDFWAVDADHGMTGGLLAALVFCLGASVSPALVLARGKASPRDLAYLVCASPCLLLAGAGMLGLYPVSHRTRLFALPCLVLLALMTVEDLLGRFRVARVAELAAWALTFGLAFYAVSNQIIEGRGVAEEDFDTAVAFLQRHVEPSDLILVHACCVEGFRLYTAMDHWSPPRILVGDTGWPCCARGKDSRPGVSTEAAVIKDLDSKIPSGYSGRVWLLYTTRPTHWIYTGLDEGNLWRKHLWERGCPPGPYLRFANLALSPMNCATAR